jgi:hypothetical protein
MNFSRTFPVTTWLWRRLTSRPARLIYLGVIIIVIISPVALRVEAALFERRVLKVVSALSSLRIGVTPKAEVLSRMAGFKVNGRSRGNARCEADECLSIELSSPKLSDWLLRKAGWSGHYNLYSVLSWWGFRYRRFTAYVDLTSGKVSELGYGLNLSTSRVSDSFGLWVGVSSKGDFVDLNLAADVDESPNYQVGHYFNRCPDLCMNVDFTRDASPELLRHAFGLKLHCIWSIAGCRTSNQLLPDAEQDRLEIRRAAFERMIGPNQCPDWILPRRARDTADILLVEVKKASTKIIVPDYLHGRRYRVASFRLLRILKGKAGRPLDELEVTLDTGSTLYTGPWWDSEQVVVHNSAIDLLNPGQQFLLFSGTGKDIFEPCAAVPATDSAIQTIERALGKGRP